MYYIDEIHYLIDVMLKYYVLHRNIMYFTVFI